MAERNTCLNPGETGRPPFSSLGDVQRFLAGRANYETTRDLPRDKIFTLERMARCVEALGRPHQAFRTIHVTGTKGKGSVSRMLAALLRATGLRVGLYTSPHVEHLLERINVDGAPVTEAAFVAACNEVRPVVDHEVADLTYFEVLTAAAFCAFRAAQVDYAVIEVGIGGRLDATNVIQPEACVITNVDYDHMELLGDTLEQIAFEKAGIIKPQVPVVCGLMPDGPRAVILSQAGDVDAPVSLIGHHYEVQTFVRIGYRGSCDLRVHSTVWRGIMLNCPAAFMATNAAQAVAAFEVLYRRGVVTELASDQLQKALEAVRFPACCEIFPGRPTVIIDGAHNAMASASLSSVLRIAFGGRDLMLVVGVPRDKEVQKIIAHLADSGAGGVIFTRYPGLRAMPPSELVPLWTRRSSAPAEVIEQPEVAFHQALGLAGEQGMVVITGAIHLAGLLRPLARTRVHPRQHAGMSQE